MELVKDKCTNLLCCLARYPQLDKLVRIKILAKYILQHQPQIRILELVFETQNSVLIEAVTEISPRCLVTIKLAAQAQRIELVKRLVPRIHCLRKIAPWLVGLQDTEAALNFAQQCLNRGVIPDYKMVAAAIASGNLKVVKLLNQYCLLKQDELPKYLSKAIHHRQTEIVKWLIRHFKSLPKPELDRFLSLAIHAINLELVIEFIKMGATDIDSGLDKLYYIPRHHQDCIKMLRYLSQFKVNWNKIWKVLLINLAVASLDDIKYFYHLGNLGIQGIKCNIFCILDSNRLDVIQWILTELNYPLETDVICQYLSKQLVRLPLYQYLVEYLIKQPSPPSLNGLVNLVLTREGNDYLKILIQTNKINLKKTLITAILKSATKCIKYLLELGVTLEEKDFRSIKKGQRNKVRHFIELK